MRRRIGDFPIDLHLTVCGEGGGVVVQGGGGEEGHWGGALMVAESQELLPNIRYYIFYP